MTILIIHNRYSKQGGEESVVAFQQKLLSSYGHNVIMYERNYKEMSSWLLGRVWGTFTSIYNPRSKRELNNIITLHKPQVAILHNLLPIISPCIIPFLHKKGIKVVQIVHNYRLLCPTGIFFNKGKICEICTAKGREWNCLKNKCTGSVFSSFSFAVKFWAIRKLKYYNSVDKFICLSEFGKNKLIENGFEANKITILPNSYFPQKEYPSPCIEEKRYLSFVGRLTKEKGFFDFINVAKALPQYDFKVAGEKTKDIQNIAIPQNITFEGFLDKDKMTDFYSHSKVVLFLSSWYEGFPMVFAESFYHFTPLIVYDLSVMAEVVENEKEGFVVPLGNTQEVIQKIIYLFTHSQEYKAMTENCREKFDTSYSPKKYYERLIKIIN